MTPMSLRTVAAVVALGLSLAAPALAQSGGGWLGLQLADGKKGGVAVRGVLPGSPAEKARLHEGEEVLAVDGKPVHAPDELVDAVGGAGAGAHIKLRVATAKGTRDVDVTLAVRPSEQALQRGALLDKPAPDVRLKSVDGVLYPSLAALRGHVVLLDFFATWCGPCREAMPRIEMLHRKLAARGLEVFGISTETQEIVAGAGKRFHLSYPIVCDEPGDVSARYLVYALPTAVLIDRAGKVRLVAIADEEAVEQAVQKLLDEK